MPDTRESRGARHRLCWAAAVVAVVCASDVSAGESTRGKDMTIATPFREWRDKDTGRLVRRLTPPSLPAWGLYHHMRVFTSDGRWMLFWARSEAGRDVYALDLRERVIRRVTHTGGMRLLAAVPGATPRALVIHDGAYEVVTVPDGVRRRVADVPPDQTFATAPDVTADGKHIVGVYIEMTDEARKIDRRNRRWVVNVWRLHLKNTLFTIDIETGRRKDFFYVRSWVDHLQCSPTDPMWITYVDQGLTQRTGNAIHVMRIDGTGRQRVAEGGAHHIWSSDGESIYHNDEYDHAAPWAYWRWDRRTGQREQVLPVSEWNFHFCTSPDSRCLVGDGHWSDPYINLYRPGQDGRFRKERLCRRVTGKLRTENMARFGPDGASVFFNGDVDGVGAIFEVVLR